LDRRITVNGRRMTLQRRVWTLLFVGILTPVFSRVLESPAGPGGILTTEQRWERGTSGVVMLLCILWAASLLVLDRLRKRRQRYLSRHQSPFPSGDKGDASFQLGSSSPPTKDGKNADEEPQ